MSGYIRVAGWLVGLGLVLLGALAVVPLASAQQIGPCRLATKGDSPVARACSQGGLIAAKQTMRGLVKQGRQSGVRFECSDCHTDDESYDRLSSDARDKFAKLLAATRKK